MALCLCGGASDFYPRSPCGERQQTPDDTDNAARISIHALLAESDAPCHSWHGGIFISIHALLAESDGVTTSQKMIEEISIHALLAESDQLKFSVTLITL